MDDILGNEDLIGPPMFPEPDFFDLDTANGIHNEEDSARALAQQLFPGNLLSALEDDDLSEVGDFIKAVEEIEAAAGDNSGVNGEGQSTLKPSKEEEQPETNGVAASSEEEQETQETDQNKSENSDVLSKKSDKEESCEDKASSDQEKMEEDNDDTQEIEDITSRRSEKSEDPNSPALSRTSTVVAIKVPKISISPKRRRINSPVRTTRGMRNNPSTRERRAKRKISDDSAAPISSESEDTDENDSDDVSEVSANRSSKPVRKSPRHTKIELIPALRPRSNRKRKKVARYANSDDEEVNTSKQEEKSDDDDMFEPVVATVRVKRYCIREKYVSYEDVHGNKQRLPSCNIRITKLTSAEIKKWCRGKAYEDEEETDDDTDKDNPFILEVCVDNMKSVEEAVKGGAKRIELCSSLSEGGLTPSPGFLTYVKEKFDVPVFVMIRPRGGDFVYSEAEVDQMERDVAYYKQLGADGFVFGILTNDCNVNTDSCRRLLRSAGPHPCTFHRAFDKVADPFSALETIISLKFSRILTSGQAATAHAGLSQIKKLVSAANKRIIILPGAGVNESNVAEIVRKSGVHEVHGSASKTVRSTMTAPGPSRSQKRGGRQVHSPAAAVKMGTTDDSIIKVTDSTKVAKLVSNGRKNVKY